VKASRNEERPAEVLQEAKQAGEARPGKWAWVERTVWTDRMLEALEQGVKGGVWFSLIDKVYRPETLRRAWQKVDTVSIEEYPASASQAKRDQSRV
jgi:hypothetical protein